MGLRLAEGIDPQALAGGSESPSSSKLRSTGS